MKTAILLLAGILAIPSVAAPPCETVDRTLTEQQKKDLESVFAKEIGVEEVEIRSAFRHGTWSIFGVETHESDEWFLFYAGDPREQHPVGNWGGVAAPFEEQEIRAWVIENVAGVPSDLATCFAWWVTHARE